MTDDDTTWREHEQDMDGDHTKSIPYDAGYSLGQVLLNKDDLPDSFPSQGYRRRFISGFNKARLDKGERMYADGMFPPAYKLPPGEKDNDPVHHPNHYTKGNIEVWDAITDWNLNFLAGSAVKYLARAGVKDPNKHVEDLEKSIAFINREIKRVKEVQSNASRPSA